METSYIKQTIENSVESVLLERLQTKVKAQVDHYNYATMLGTLDHIDYAIPLFGYARETKESAVKIYDYLREDLESELPCKTEFVNGYTNIRLGDDFLSKFLGARSGEDHVIQTYGIPTTLVASSDDPQTDIVVSLIKECLDQNQIDAVATRLDDQRTKPRAAVRQALSQLPGVVVDPDSEAIYIHKAAEPHALCSARGHLYAPALLLAAIKEHLNEKRQVFVIGASDLNQLVRAVFPHTACLDTDIHARHVNESFKASPYQLISKNLKAFKSQLPSELTVKQRRTLLRNLDFNYEVMKALGTGDLKGVLGELTMILRQ